MLGWELISETFLEKAFYIYLEPTFAKTCFWLIKFESDHSKRWPTTYTTWMGKSIDGCYPRHIGATVWVKPLKLFGSIQFLCLNQSSPPVLNGQLSDIIHGNYSIYISIFFFAVQLFEVKPVKSTERVRCNFLSQKCNYLSNSPATMLKKCYSSGLVKLCPIELS